ncbi:rhodanese-like domain-containing protein [Aquiflexum sp. LQ15W]|uniref:rhodanese-like domain-containing protein n=1 Tax=Cognataquiflexum nitidum TaxID=2922272 RepID=UPI001F141B32|nr:rhodanese-like domain-containing protein [Cognataquiflexum nitidum]MCH6199403.1 rhodanese-like domain-containing protein [Cognataquiflexum nitidum]
MNSKTTWGKSVCTLMVLTLFFAFPKISTAQEGAPKLSPAEFDIQAYKGKKAVILDIRTPEEIAEGHIEGATFINWTGGNFEEEVSKLNRKKTYYVYCRSAKRTIPATEKMMGLGFKKIYMLEGGLNNWVESGKPVTKPEKK